jgi:DNA-binding transcriptional regulator GbsR (MarR family)
MILTDLLYPRTKFEVLRTLYYANAPVPLREISYRANIVVGSVQTALKSLLREKIVSRKDFKGRHYYQLSNAEFHDALVRLLQVLEPSELQEQAKCIQDRARSLLPQLEERNKIIEHARRSLKS